MTANSDIYQDSNYQTNFHEVVKQEYFNPKIRIQNLQKTKILKWQFLEKGNTKKVLYKEEFSNELIVVTNQFNKSYKEKKEIFKKIPFSIINKKFNEVIYHALKLDYDTIHTGATEDLSIYFRISFGNLSAFIEIFFDEEKIEETENILNIIENKEIKLSKCDEIEYIIEDIKNETEKLNYSMENIFFDYELSGTFITQD